MTRLNSKTFFVTAGITLALTNVALADATHYPYENFAHAGEWSGVYFGKSGETELAINLMLDPSFSNSQKSIIKQGMKAFVDRSLRESVLSCAFNSSTKDFPESRQKFKSQMLEALSYRKLDDLTYPGYAYVGRFWNDINAAGLGFINLFYDRSNALPGYKDRHYLHVALNSDHLGEESQYFLARDFEYWAGVLGHEFLHNLGYVHPTGYSGSFVKEYGNCVWKNGTDRDLPEGTLEDAEVHKDM